MGDTFKLEKPAWFRVSEKSFTEFTEVMRANITDGLGRSKHDAAYYPNKQYCNF